MKAVFDDFSPVDAGDRKGEYIDLFMVYCDELSKDDPMIRQYDYAALAMENLQKSTDRPMLILAEKDIIGLRYSGMRPMRLVMMNAIPIS